jgi:membrane protease YdiL (CAAX protease family)
MDWAQPAAIFALIVAYIWFLRYIHPWFWMAIVGAMVLSHALRRETPADLGFRVSDFRECAIRLAPGVALLGLLFSAAGLLCGTIRAVSIGDGLAAWAVYLPWGVAQQYALNGYFLNRLQRASSPRTAVVLATALFSAVHAPNWFLMAVTLAGGACCTLIYQRWRNLYALGLAHGTLGFLLYLVVPDSISHHLRVGWGWFR